MPPEIHALLVTYKLLSAFHIRVVRSILWLGACNLVYTCLISVSPTMLSHVICLFFFALHKKTIGLTSLHVTLLIGLKFRIKRYFPLVDEELLLVAAVDGSVVVGVVLALYPSRVHHIM